MGEHRGQATGAARGEETIRTTRLLEGGVPLDLGHSTRQPLWTACRSVRDYGRYAWLQQVAEEGRS